jgi:hypothetical protein
MTEPAWLTRARSYIGFHELPGNRGIGHFINGAKSGGSEGESWCADFANCCIEESGWHGTRRSGTQKYPIERDLQRRAGRQRAWALPGKRVDAAPAGASACACRDDLDLRDRR